MRRPPPVPAEAGAAVLASEPRARLDKRLPALAARPPELHSGLVTRFGGRQATRLETIRTIGEHDRTHRAQLFLCLRLKRIVPVTTRRRQAAK